MVTILCYHSNSSNLCEVDRWPQCLCYHLQSLVLTLFNSWWPHSQVSNHHTLVLLYDVVKNLVTFVNTRFNPQSVDIDDSWWPHCKVSSHHTLVLLYDDDNYLFIFVNIRFNCQSLDIDNSWWPHCQVSNHHTLVMFVCS